MDKIIGVIGGVPQSKSRNDDDWVDRLSHRYSTAVLVIFAIIVSTKQYVGEPINCWVPAHFTGNHEEYTNNYCWIRNTYYLPWEDHIPKEHEYDKRHMIPYYQWIPMILLVQALMFYLPCMVWRTMNNRSGIDVNNIVEAGETFQNAEMAESRDKTLRYMTKQMDRYLHNAKQPPPGCAGRLKAILTRACCFICGRKYGNYLVALYLVVKLLYIANVIGQLFVLNQFLGTDYHMYGIDVLRALSVGEDWTASPRFPRVTMCDFKVRRLGNVQRYTVQCVLPINLFNEKIYLFIWFWMVFVAAMSCISFLTWLLRSLFRIDRYRYIKKHLRLFHDNLETEQEKKRIKKFCENYLRQDGVFVLRLVGHNTNAITVTEFISSMWKFFCKKPLAEQSNPDASEV